MVAQDILSTGIEIPLPLIILLLGGLITPIIGLISEKINFRRLREIWALIVISISAVSVITLYNQILEAPNNILLMTIWGQNPPLGGCFEVDMLSVYMTGSISVIGILVMLYSISYMEKEDRLTEFYTLFIFMLAGMAGVALAANWERSLFFVPPPTMCNTSIECPTKVSTISRITLYLNAKLSRIALAILPLSVSAFCPLWVKC